MTTRASTTVGCATRAASRIRRSTSTSGSRRRWSATAASCDPCPGSARSRPPPGWPSTGAGSATLVGGQASNEEGWLLERLAARGAGVAGHRLARRRRDWRDRGADAGGSGATGVGARPRVRSHGAAAGSRPRDDAPILDLRIRKGVRRHGVKLAIASARPTALDPNAALIARYAPGAEALFVDAPRPRAGGADDVDESVAALAALLRDSGEDVVIVYAERHRRRRRGGAVGDRRRAVARSARGRRTAGVCQPVRTAAGCVRQAASRTPDPATRRSATWTRPRRGPASGRPGGRRERSALPPPPAS